MSDIDFLLQNLKKFEKKNIFGNFLEKIALNQKMALFTKPGNPYYLVLLENRTKPGTVLSETVISGDSLLYLALKTKIIV